MAVLSIYLSPFAPDYSGVSSVLFDLNTVTAMHDASGCTGNYTGYDEPRWYGSKSPIYCSGLREIDAVLGDDEKLIRKMTAAAEDLKPELLALVGSPVPMVIGSDLPGIAEELEERTGIPSLGFDTTGTAYYDKGVAMATIGLLKKITEKQERIPGTVNILGANPLDFGRGENLEDLKALIRKAGYEITACLSMGYTMEDLKRAASAQVNLAVSRAGFLIGEYMWKAYGIPYLCGLPVGEKGAAEYGKELARTAETGEPVILNGEPMLTDGEGEAAAGNVETAAGNAEAAVGNAETAAGKAEPPAGEILILGEQVQSNAIRLALEKEYGRKNIVVGCLFGLERKLALPQDKNLASEAMIKEELNKPGYQVIIADPFMKQLLKKESGAVFLEHAQYAVSSKVAVEKTARIMGEKFHGWYTMQ